MFEPNITAPAQAQSGCDVTAAMSSYQVPDSAEKQSDSDG
jgi:hypothetical protein